jgi:hypothetical protein
MRTLRIFFSTENPTGYPRFVLRSARGYYYFKTSFVSIISFRPSHDICNIQPRKHIKRYFNSNIHRNWSWLWLIGCYFHSRWTDSAIFMTRVNEDYSRNAFCAILWYLHLSVIFNDFLLICIRNSGFSPSLDIVPLQRKTSLARNDITALSQRTCMV